MVDVDGFVNAGRPRGRSRWSAPPPEFEFGPYSVSRDTTIRVGLPRRGVAGGETHLVVTHSGTGYRAICELERVGMPLMSELKHGIRGSVDGEPFVVRRTGGLQLRRKDRLVVVSGVVNLSLSYEHGRSVIHGRGERALLLWTSSSGGLLSRDATHKEAAVVCMLVVNAFEQSTSLTRFLHFL